MRLQPLSPELLLLALLALSSRAATPFVIPPRFAGGFPPLEPCHSASFDARVGDASIVAYPRLQWQADTSG
jgi:hypothetical protein